MAYLVVVIVQEGNNKQFRVCFMRVSLVSISTSNDKPASERMVEIGGVTSADELTWY